MVGVGGLALFAYGGVKSLTGASFDEVLAIGQNINVSVAQSILFGFIALVLGSVLLFVS